MILFSMITADFAAAAVLISFGALLGKISPMQLIILAMFEIAIYAVNEYIGVVLFKVCSNGFCFGFFQILLFHFNNLQVHAWTFSCQYGSSVARKSLHSMAIYGNCDSQL